MYTSLAIFFRHFTILHEFHHVSADIINVSERRFISLDMCFAHISWMIDNSITTHMFHCISTNIHVCVNHVSKSESSTSDIVPQFQRFHISLINVLGFIIYILIKTYEILFFIWSSHHQENECSNKIIIGRSTRYFADVFECCNQTSMHMLVLYWEWESRGDVSYNVGSI